MTKTADVSQPTRFGAAIQTVLETVTRDAKPSHSERVTQAEVDQFRALQRLINAAPRPLIRAEDFAAPDINSAY